MTDRPKTDADYSAEREALEAKIREKRDLLTEKLGFEVQISVMGVEGDHSTYVPQIFKIKVYSREEGKVIHDPEIRRRRDRVVELVGDISHNPSSISIVNLSPENAMKFLDSI